MSPSPSVPHRQATCKVCGLDFLAGKYWQVKKQKAIWQKACSPECRRIIRKSLRGKRHPLWRGDNIGYAGVHQWFRETYPPPSQCSHCKQARKLEAANRSGRYLRRKYDWVYLCHPCHVKMDADNHKRDRFGRFRKCTSRIRLWNSREVGRIAKVKSHNAYVRSVLGI